MNVNLSFLKFHKVFTQGKRKIVWGLVINTLGHKLGLNEFCKVQNCDALVSFH